MKSLPLALAVASIVLVAFLAMRLGSRERNELAQRKLKEVDADPALSDELKPSLTVAVAPELIEARAPTAPLGSVWLKGQFGSADGSQPAIDDSFKVRVFGTGQWAVLERTLELDRDNRFELELTKAFDAWQNLTAIQIVASSNARPFHSARRNVSDVPRRRRVEARVTLEINPRFYDERGLVLQGRVNGSGEARVGITEIDPSAQNAANLRDSLPCFANIDEGGAFCLFECHVPGYGRPPETLWLAVECNGWLPHRSKIQIQGRKFIDVGTIELERGESIRGRIPLSATARDRVTVCATELEPKKIDEFSSQIRQSDPAGCTVRADTNAAGEFELTGLVPGWYRLKLVDVPGLGDAYTTHVEVLAPATGVVIEPQLCRVDMLVQRAGAAVKQARIEVRRRHDEAGFSLRRSLVCDANGRASAWIASDDITEIAIGERVFPIAAGAPGGVIPLVIDL